MKYMIVKAWIEKVIIPTYGAGEPDKNPMFFEKRIYQGSSGVVYPNPVIEKISDEKEDRGYTAVFLENAFIKIMILPELGGRVQMAYDKIKERHFIYYNQVIKPALVGLCGPWISGGIEFNWPQHHRPSTFDAVDFNIEENTDGSVTVWVNELEKMFHTKGMAGFTLHPDHAYLEIKARLSNPTPLPQTFLWWANPAVKVNDHYQSVFPPDVNAVFDHGKRDVSTFPIATGTYYKVDYSPGTDISMYKNIPVPTSYMAVNSAYDFVGGYEHDSKAGMLHIADHHVSPGKKQWTWGNGDFGIAWDRNLTDEDGPYIELMTGVYTDNQPDFTWLMPFEEKSFTQYFLPYRELGLIKNASKDLLLSLDLNQNELGVKVFATSMYKSVGIRVFIGADLLFEDIVDIDPYNIYDRTLNGPDHIKENAITVSIIDKNGKELLRYNGKQENEDIPVAAAPAESPADINNAEQLFLTGQHLEQYRHATFNPVPYYEKALELDPGDVRNNNALGVWYLRRGMFEKSEAFFRAAIKTLIARNPNPYDGEPYFNLGLSLKYLGRKEEVYEAFFKAGWSSAWQDAAYYFIAQLDLLKGDYEKALEHINWSIDRNARNGKAYLIKIQALKKMGKVTEALSVAQSTIERDGFNFGALYQLYLCYQELQQEDKAMQTLNLLKSRSRGTAHNLIECTIDFINQGLYQDAAAILLLANKEEFNTPLINYYLVYIYSRSGDQHGCMNYLTVAAVVDPGYCFPNRLEDIKVLKNAMKLNPADSKAPYYLGNLYFDKRQYAEAISLWELSYQIDSEFATVNRNLGIALFNKSGDKDRALFHFNKAFQLNKNDARMLMELDQLYKRLNYNPEKRLAFLQENLGTATLRDDVYLEIAAIRNFLGDFGVAYDMLMNRKFHPWEGGEGKVAAQYTYSLMERAKLSILKKNPETAIELLNEALRYPDNLGEGKLPGARDNDIYFWLGCAYQASGDEETAGRSWKTAAIGDEDPSAAVFYNDSPPDKIFYQGLALRKIGDDHRAESIFNKLISYGQQHIDDQIKIDYFAVSLPDLMVFDGDLNLLNRIHCLYLQGLGQLGLNNRKESVALFQQVLEMETMHLGAKTHLDLAASYHQLADSFLKV
ncbi:tetratricopeptide (TPR) repeat protein [Mucilaginibacter gracilis]|uniref:Tetratricopeptide (TPR) repeat protein n=1 Tax=Mucilaginibacter gracilis TaxID=423350 RepID=A0A495IX67_9SPHI|nr:DUF5107 domain-containing protein [Mucilaginibacter gracilis]RKR80469.1 tetratricopeptide (TPR) repeat protein [Mucilaginibacter gracilis]